MQVAIDLNWRKVFYNPVGGVGLNKSARWNAMLKICMHLAECWHKKILSTIML